MLLCRKINTVYCKTRTERTNPHWMKCGVSQCGTWLFLQQHLGFKGFFQLYALTYMIHHWGNGYEGRGKSRWWQTCLLVLAKVKDSLVKARESRPVPRTFVVLATTTYISCSFATRMSQLKIWHFWVIGIEKKVCRCTFNRYSVVTQFVKLAAGERLCRRCTHRKL